MDSPAVDVRGHTLFVGTPMYDGRCQSEFAFAMVQLSALCSQLGVALHCFFACHEALIATARNATVNAFLRSECDHLMFIDSDIGFDPYDVIRLLALQVADPGLDYDVIAAPYPLKRIDWGQLRRAAEGGLADSDAAALANVASPIAVHPVHAGSFLLNQPLEVTQAGTGFMMIRRSTFERLHQIHPRPSYRSREVGIEKDAEGTIIAFFDTAIDSKNDIATQIRELVSCTPHASAADVLILLEESKQSNVGEAVAEDYAFCRAVREAGMHIWLCPWMVLSHTGNHRFTSRLADVALVP